MSAVASERTTTACGEVGIWLTGLHFNPTRLRNRQRPLGLTQSLLVKVGARTG